MHLNSREKVFTVVTDTYVSDTSGTGCVGQSPYFGADDFRICIKYGVIKKDECVARPIDECGVFMDEVSRYKGLYFKDADKEIVKDLKAERKLFLSGSEKHSYPFCWRSNTPLMYKAVSSWFVRVDNEALMKSNENVNW